jgi:hypothetical protein
MELCHNASMRSTLVILLFIFSSCSTYRIAPPVKVHDLKYVKFESQLKDIKVRIKDSRSDKKESTALVFQMLRIFETEVQNAGIKLSSESKNTLEIDIHYYLIGLSGTFCTTMIGITAKITGTIKKEKKFEDYARSVPCVTKVSAISSTQKALNNILSDFAKWM